jgi:hypothetical protein
MDGLADRATMTGDRRIGCTTTPVRAFAGRVGIQPPGQTGYAATESTSTDSRFAVDQFKGSSHSLFDSRLSVPPRLESFVVGFSKAATEVTGRDGDAADA